MSNPVEELQTALRNPIHPELGPVMPVNWSTFPGQDEELQGQINDFTNTLAAAVAHTLRERGYRIVHETEIPQHPKIGSYDLTILDCEACSTVFQTSTPKAGNRISVSHRGLPPCPACHPNEA